MINKLIKGISLGSASIVCLTSTLNADVTSTEDDIMDLPKVTVVASRLELSSGTVGSSVTTLDIEDLVRYEDELASDVIRHIEGVYLRNNGNSGSTSGITMRGLPVAPVVLIDGVEVNDPGSGSVFNFGNLPMASIASIEVLRGAQSALYGSNALTGVISITTKQGISSSPTAVMGVSYGSRDTVNAYATLSQSTEKLNYFVTATYMDTDGYSVQNPEWGAEWADKDLQRNNSLLGKVNYKLTDKVDLSVFGSYQTARNQYDPGAPSIWTVPTYENYVDSDQLLGKAQLKSEISDRWTATMSLSYNDYKSYAFDSFGIRDNEAEVIKIDLLNEVKFTNWLESVIGFEKEDAKDRIGDYSMTTSAAFIENVVTLTESLHATLALRIDDNDTFGSKTTWRTSFSYELPTQNTRLKGSYGVSFDAPEISELFGTWGNPDLKPEDGYNFDLGLEHSFNDSLKLGVTFFKIGIQDHIEYLRSTYTYANVDWESTGLETYIDWNATENLFIRLSHTWADAERKGADDSLLFHSPKHNLSLMMDYSMLNERWIQSLTIQYVGERETWSGATDAFTVVDLASRYHINEYTEVWVRAENLLDESYEEILGYIAPGFGIFGGFKIEF